MKPLAATRRWALITGAGNVGADQADGIGAALAIRMLSAGISVVAVGRRQSALDRTRQLFDSSRSDARLVTVAADIATASGRSAVVSAVPSEDSLAFLVHNAAVGDPSSIGGGGIDIEHFRCHSVTSFSFCCWP